MSKKKSQAHNGVAPLSKHHWITSFQSLPTPRGQPPYHFWKLRTGGGNGSTIFHVIGDTGGIKHPEPQQHVADQMVASSEGARFCYHLGDVVYYNGEAGEYYSQFYEPYRKYELPIYAIPGNHDGTPIDEQAVSLEAWCGHFMSPENQVRSECQDALRNCAGQPNCYWTLITDEVWIVGLYTNIPEHGSVDSVQAQWLTHELASAPEDKALIVAMHHPVYSFDGHHSGSPAMADLLEHAISDARRAPNMVMAGHVHNYQRIEQTIGGKLIPFIVCGNGGYWHLHDVNAELGDHGESGDVLRAKDDKNHGFLTIGVDKNTITGQYRAVGKDGKLAGNDDVFSYTTEPIKLQATVKL